MNAKSALEKAIRLIKKNGFMAVVSPVDRGDPIVLPAMETASKSYFKEGISEIGAKKGYLCAGPVEIEPGRRMTTPDGEYIILSVSPNRIGQTLITQDVEVSR